eukprot:CAMPEP_0114497014 /NCGR_PEP_ID=MMETSP0109-20121206/6084_1 /TAXON_ID=29199 /ORGANISM="Chlorarachnion reptans, Strain CCCM449" /LENGTH=35 /DNA_ID= /DNA_START= /DNA_END= /DNA_ORIENTATION=
MKRQGCRGRGSGPSGSDGDRHRHRDARSGLVRREA